MLGDTKDVEKSQCFFRHCETFFGKHFPTKGPPEILDVLQQWMLKIPKGPPFDAPARQYPSTIGFSGFL